MTSNTNIFDLLANSARQFPARRAIKDRNKWYNYLYLKEHAEAIARVLHSYSIQAEDRVLLLCNNSVDYIVSYFALLRLGATVVPIPTDITVDGFKDIVADCLPKAIILQPQFHKIVAPSPVIARAAEPLIFHTSKSNQVLEKNIFIIEELITQSPKKLIPQPELVVSENLALILYTSGSTAKPKGVCLTHGNVTANVEAICEYLQLTDADVMMQILPFYYSYGKSFLHALIKSGGSLVINNHFTYCNLVLKELEDEKCTGFAGVPSTFHILLNHSKLAEFQFPHLRFVTQAGGHLQVNSRQKLRDCLPVHVKLFIMYGQTEATARLTYLPPDKFNEKIGSVGKPLNNVILNIKDENGETLPAHENGEIWAKGPNVMTRYWNNVEETEKVIQSGYLRTGDLGYLDEEGYLYITGRLKRMIKSGGYRVNSREIENIILEHDHVQDVFVFGVPDVKMGEAIQAMVVLKMHKDIEPVIKFCKNNFPFHKIPQHFITVKQIPRKASGKIDLNTIRSLCHATN